MFADSEPEYYKSSIGTFRITPSKRGYELFFNTRYVCSRKSHYYCYKYMMDEFWPIDEF